MDQHKKLLTLAATHGADMIIFPELSLTGYEPKLAKELATDLADTRFNDFQKISDAKQLTIGVGMPIQTGKGVTISMILFQPSGRRQVYSKHYLHSDEEGFFVSGERSPALIVHKTHVALAICYELSVPEHAENAAKSGAEVYIASVAKFVNGIDKAIKRLSDIASRYSMTVFMSNCVGQSDGLECAGKTSIWNNKGILAGQLDDKNEGILIFDTTTGEVIQKNLSKSYVEE
jgi:predicted amidohydrolase